MATLTVEAEIDATMDRENPDVNSGASDQLGLGALYVGGEKVALFRVVGNFDVSALAGATISSAKLVRTISGVVNGGFDAHLSRCTRPADWVEAQATWNDYDEGLAWTAGGGDFDDTGPPAKIDYAEATATGDHEITGLKGFAEDALDNRSGIVSLILRSEDEAPPDTARVNWWSKDKGTDVWRLVIDYTVPAPANPGRRGGRRSRLASGAAPARPARPAQPAASARPARPHGP